MQAPVPPWKLACMTRLQRVIAIALAAKLLLLGLLYELCFSPAHRPSVAVGDVTARLLPTR